MNNPWTASRLAAGDYDGVRLIGGKAYRSLLREYADAVAAGIIDAYRGWTTSANSSLAKTSDPTAPL
jgi:hypothetical protein